MKATYFLTGIVLAFLFVTGCATTPETNGSLGYSQERRVVIVGENTSQDIAVYYQRRYDALVWFTPNQGILKDSTHEILKGLGPSHAMKALINELNSINYTVGRWEIIIPKLGEGYFLSTLEYMPSGTLAHARGDIVLIDSKGNKDIESQVSRVTDNCFFVTYEFQKY